MLQTRYAFDNVFWLFVIDRIQVENAATTYHVACLAGSDDCDFVQPYTLVQGPKSVHMEITAPFHSMTQ